MILEDPSDTHEYLSVIGHPPLVEGARRLALGPDSPAIKEKRVRLAVLFLWLPAFRSIPNSAVGDDCGCVGSVCKHPDHLGHRRQLPGWAVPVKVFPPRRQDSDLGSLVVYVFAGLGSSGAIRLLRLCWASPVNHTTIFENLGFEVAAYRYYDPVTVAIDIDGMIESLRVQAASWPCCCSLGPQPMRALASVGCALLGSRGRVRCDPASLCSQSNWD